MTRTRLVLLLTSLAAAATLPAAPQSTRPPEAGAPSLVRLQAMTARFAPVPLGADVAKLPPGEQQVALKLVEAARVMDVLFLRQVWAGNDPLLMSLARDETPLGRARLRYFLINKGPWSRLDEDAPFITGVGAKPEGANFYAADATRQEVESWIASLPEDEKSAALSFFTIVFRGADGQLHAAPYTWPTRPTSRARRSSCAKRRGSPPSRRSRPSWRSARPPSSATTTTRATWPGWSWTPPSSPPSGPTRRTRTSGSATRRPSRRT